MISALVLETQPAGLDAKPYTRALIPGDAQLAPYELTGSRRRLFVLLYVAIVATALGATAYTLYASPAFGAAALALGYLAENVDFSCGHLVFHTEFIEVPESRMSTLVHNSFIHHYRTRTVFHERWLESRLSYFVDIRSSFSLRSAIRLLAIAGFVLGACYFASPVFGAALISMWLPRIIQSVVHEWYHNPRKYRKTFYSPPVYWFLTLLEKSGLASTRRHTVHHQHDLRNLHEVDNWLDLYIPFGEILPTWLWRKALSQYEPGKTRMNEFARRVQTIEEILNLFVSFAVLTLLYRLLHG